MSNNSIGSNTYDLLKEGLKASTIRDRVIANNVANINTKGYKKFRVVFEENLKNNVNNSLMKTSDERHISNISKEGSTKILRDNSGSMRNDGNNVDIDSEMINLAANTLKFNALVNEINSTFRMREKVIRGGK